MIFFGLKLQIFAHGVLSRGTELFHRLQTGVGFQTQPHAQGSYYLSSGTFLLCVLDHSWEGPNSLGPCLGRHLILTYFRG